MPTVDSMTVIYQDSFIKIVKGEYRSDENFNWYDINQGDIRYWIYSADGLSLLAHSNDEREYGYQMVYTPVEGIIRAEFTNNQWYYFNRLGNVLNEFPFKTAEDFNNGLGKYSYSQFQCFIDYLGNRYVASLENNLIQLPPHIKSASYIDSKHIAAYMDYVFKCYLFDQHFNPICINNEHVSYNQIEPGPTSWSVILRSQTPLGRNERRILNLQTNTYCFVDLGDIRNNYQFSSIGNACLRITDCVHYEEREYDEETRQSTIYTVSYTEDILIFSNGYKFETRQDIQIVEEDGLILLHPTDGRPIDNRSGCISYDGEWIIPNVFSKVELNENRIYAYLSSENTDLSIRKFIFTKSGELCLNGKCFPKGISTYEHLRDHIYLVQIGMYSWQTIFKKGIYDYEANSFLLPIEYDSIDLFSDNFIVCKEGKFGLLDSDYKSIIECKYDSLEIVSDNLFIVSEKKGYNKFYNLINKEEEILLPYKFKHISIFDNKYLCFEMGNRSWRSGKIYTDLELNTIINFDTDYCKTLNGFYYLYPDQSTFEYTDGKYGMVNHNSKVITSNRYDKLEGLGAPGLYLGELNEQKYLINLNTEVELPLHYSNVWLEQTEISVEPYLRTSSSKGCGLITFNGEIILDSIYDSFWIFDDHIKIEKNDKVGVTDLDGNIIIPCQYIKYEKLDNGYYIVQGLYAALYSPYGTQVVSESEQYRSIQKTDSDCLKTTSVDGNLHRHYGILSTTGKLRHPATLSYVGKFINKEAVFTVDGVTKVEYNPTTRRKEVKSNGGKSGVINELGIVKIKPAYDYIFAESKSGYRVAYNLNNGVPMYGLVSPDDTLILQLKYSYLRNVENGLVVYATGGFWSENGNKTERLAVRKGDAGYLVNAKWGVMNLDGSTVIEPIAEYIRPISENKVTFKNSETQKYSVLDLTLNTIHETDYDELFTYKEGVCIAGRYDPYFKRMQYGYIDSDYNELVGCMYDKAENFKDGKGLLIDGDSEYTVDKEGNIIDTYVDNLKDSDYDYHDDTDWERETWYALTGGQYGDYPGGDIDYDKFGL